MYNFNPEKNLEFSSQQRFVRTPQRARDNVRYWYIFKMLSSTILLLIILSVTIVAMLLTEIWSLAALIGISIGMYLIYIVYVIRNYKKSNVPKVRRYKSSTSMKTNRESIPPPPTNPPPTLAKCRFSEEGARTSMMQWVKIESFKLDMDHSNSYSSLQDDTSSFDSNTINSTQRESIYSII